MYGGLFAQQSGLLQYLIDTVYAATGIVRPNANGTTNQGTPTICGTAAAFDCLNDTDTYPATPSNTSTDVLVQSRNNVDFVQMTDNLTDIATATAITVYVYHLEGSGNMQLDVSLWDNGQTVALGGTSPISLSTVTTGTGAWGVATWSGLSLTQTQINNMYVRLRCQRVSGGGSTDCRSFVAHANITYDPVINVTVSSAGSQQNVEKGFTNQWLGGQFIFTGNTDNRDITSITITETGSINAATGLSNVKLFYENSTNCSAETYNGTESQYDTAKTFNGSNKATFSVASGVGVTTSSQLCVYVVADVTTSATAGQTIDVEITNPSTEVTGSSGAVVAPSSAVAITSSSNILEENLRQMRYHWRNDNGTNETDATSATNNTEGVAYEGFPRNQPKRLRVEVSNEGTGISDATQYVLEYAEKVTTCSALGEGAWTGVGDAADAWDEVASGVISSGNTSNILALANGAVTDENTVFDGVGALMSNSATSSAITLANNEFTELEYTIEATNSATEGGSYCFRVTAAGSPITYDIYPEAIIGADLTVSAFGTQTSQILIPTTDAYNGGGFSVVDTSAGSTHDITAVTIHASGTVDLVNDIDDIELWYEYDTTGGDGYNCSDQGYGVGGAEFQYGVTDTNGFSATGTATFSDTGLTASTTSGVCLYVIYTVGSNASDGELIEVRLADPTTDIVVDAGSLSPAALTDITGITELVKEKPQQIHYHWRNDDGNEAGATSATNGNQDTTLAEMAQNTTYRIRIEVSNEGGATTTAKQYQLEWGQRISTCSEVSTWYDVDDPGDEFTMFNSGNVSDGNTSNVLSAANGAVTDENTVFDGVGALRDTSSLSGSITLDPTEFTELEYAIRATASTTEGATYCFRVTDNGTPLPSTDYIQYPKATIKLGTDFVVHRNVSIMSGQTITITNGAEYTLQQNDASRAFIRITNTSHTGAGPGGTGNFSSDDVTAYILDPGNITTSVTFSRGVGFSGNTRIYWEIIEYIGDPGGDNEFIVRDTDYLEYGTGAGDLSTTTQTVSGIVDDADVVVFITGQWNPDTGRFDYNTGQSTAAWNAGSDTATFTRGESAGDATRVSYAVVEFVGTNWQIRRVEHNYASTNEEFSTISPPLNGSINRAFVHAQKRTGSGHDTHADFGHTVWISGLNQINFDLPTGASFSGQASVAWIIENTQTQGNVMRVSRSGTTIPGGATAPATVNVNINNTVDDRTIASIFTTSGALSTSRTFPEPIIGATILNSSSTQYQLWIGDTTDDIQYRTEVVEWPTASSKMVQNDYRLYYDNDLSTPTSSWSGLGENMPMTGATDPIASGENIRIRMNLTVTAANLPAGVDAFQLEYGEMQSSCSAIPESGWYQLGEIGSTTALWRGHAGAPVDGSTLASTTLSSSNRFGTYEEENDTSLTPVTALVDDNIEFDWNIEDNGAKDKTSYCFRMTYADDTLLFDYTSGNYPIIRTVGYGPVIGDWKWFDDETSLTPSVPLDGAATNTAPANVANDNIIKLRTVVEERSGASGNNIKFKLQYSQFPDFADGGHDVVSTTTCAQTATTTAQLWCYADGAGVDNAIIDDNTLGSADACVAGSGAGCGTHNEGTSTTTATFDHTALTNAEFEFTLVNNGARAGAVYYFRLFDLINNEAVTASSSYPSLSAETAQLVFTASGLEAGTTTEGIVTDVATASTSISFGELPFDTQYEAAYRLNVNTNSTEGYQVFMIADQEMQNGYAETVPAVAGTNASPVGWGFGCSGQVACFGYHVGDDALFGGSARFAGDDTYAAIVPAAVEEVAYSPVPANESHDIVYRMEVSEEQPAGQYAMNVSFIVIPVY